MKVPRILHYPGSKWSMADWIIEHMPQHKTYLEPYFGSGAVLFSKHPSEVETVNDIHDQVVNLFRVIRDRADELAEKIRWTPHSRTEYYAAYDETEDDLENARRFLVRCWMARGAKTSDRTGWRHIIDANGPNVSKQWNRMPENILAATDRLKEVQIECQPALTIIERYKREDVLIYADPPYILETRSRRMYKHEMKIEDHIELLDALDKHPGPVLLSGYAHSLYDESLKHWQRKTFQSRTDSTAIREEVLWINPVAAEQVGQISMFEHGLG